MMVRCTGKGLTVPQACDDTRGLLKGSPTMQRRYECMRCGQVWEHVSQQDHAEHGEVHGLCELRPSRSCPNCDQITPTGSQSPA